MGGILTAKAKYIREKAKVDAARITQKSGNEKRAAQSSLARFSQSLSNKNKMDAAGEQIDSITENMAVAYDASTRGKVGRQIAAAEELGASVAYAATAGVGGSSMDMYNSTVRLSNAIQEDSTDGETSRYMYLSGKQKGGVMQDSVSSMGNDYFLADMDYTQYVDPPKPSTFKSIATLGIAAAATVFGGPKAGAAVLSIAEAGEAARWGDFGAADAAYNRAAGSVFSAVSDARATRARPAPAAPQQPASASPRGASFAPSQTGNGFSFSFGRGGGAALKIGGGY